MEGGIDQLIGSTSPVKGSSQTAPSKPSTPIKKEVVTFLID